MPLNFDLVAVNPNDSIGGGGTLAAEMRDADVRGPYFVWPATTMDSAISPHVVVAASEVRAMADALERHDAGELDVLAGGERNTPDAVELQPVGQAPTIEAPEFDFSDPDAFKRAAQYAHGED